jgi:CSLREA domain-containing protein
LKLREPSLESGELPANETRGPLTSALTAGAIALSAVSAQAATITVNTLADNTTSGDAQCTLREALANANANADTTVGDCVAGSGADTINLTALAGTITLGGAQLSISDSATITGPGASTLTIDAANNSRVFYIYNNAAAISVTVSGLTTTRGRGANGGNIVSKGEILTLNNTTVSSGIATGSGGGVANIGGTLTVQASTISGNTAQSTNGGGGIYNVGGALTITGSTLSGNSATSLAGRGGALSILSTTQPSVISNTQFTNNNASGRAGAIALKTSAAAGTLSIDHSVVTGNTASGRGGAFFLYRNAGAITIDDTQITNNTTQNRGGGIFLYNAAANVTITDTTISGNTAPTAAGNGAGVFLYKALAGVTVTLERSTISGNTAARAAGGIFFYKGAGTLAIVDSTIANNNSGTNGGAIFDRGPFGGTALLRIEESTISGNTAGTAGGNLSVTAVPTTIENTIIANGTAPASPDAATGATNVTMNYSLLENTSGATFGGAGNITGVDPNLGPLQDNGGPTFTVRPNGGSPVLDAGDPSFTPPPSTDQRGLARVYNGRIDIGALEQGAQSTISFGTSGTTVSEGAGSAAVTVTRSSGEGAASVNYSTSNGSAEAGADYTATSATVTFAPGDFTPKTINVPILEDTIDEANETFALTLSVPVNATLAGPTTATVTITDNDPTPALSISSVSQAEGDAGTTTFNFVVSLSNPSAATVTVNYATANGTAVAGSDFAAQSGTLTFAPGTTVQTIPISVLGDTTNEANENFTVVLTAPSNATIGTGAGTGTINNDDAAPSISIGDVTLAEGNSGTTAFSFPVTLSAPSALTVTVNYATASGSAVAPGDFTAASGTVTFAPGVTSQTISVPVVGDTTNEANETFTVQLSTPANASITDGSATGTITNDDGIPALSIGDVSQAEGNSGTTSFTFDVTLSAASGQTVTIDYATSNGSAIAGIDYAATSGTLTFAPGVTSQQVTVLVNGDTTNEPNETFNITLSTPVNATISDSTALGTIVNDDGAPALNIGDVSQAEGNSGTTSFMFTVTLSAPSEQTVLIDYATANGSAVAGSDYGATSGTLTFAPGVTSQTITVPVTGDVVNEASETFTVTLANPSNATVADGSATGTIVNDDGVPAISIAGASQNEGNSGTTSMPFNVTLSAPSEQTVTVNYSTVNGNAVAASDYTAATGTVTFALGMTSQTINIPIAGDTVSEIDETFSVVLSSPSNATITTGNATGTIVDDDAVPSVSIDSVSQAEGSSGTSNFAFTVSLSQASERTVTVSYATSDGSAMAGSDYTATSGTVTFAPGVTSQTINVPVSGDTTKEASETFIVALSSPVNATLGTATGTGTIVDDDNAPVLAIDSVSQAEGNSGSTSFTFTVTLSQPSGETVTVNYATANGTATAGEDYGATSGTLTFTPGVTSQTITVPVTGDVTSEANETFTVTLSSATNAPIGTANGTGTIVNDDSVPTLSIANASQNEANTATTNMPFNVTLSAPSEQTVTVDYSTVNGSAVAGSDYTASSGTVTFAPGVTSQVIDIPIIGDTVSETNETFGVVLSAPTNATIAASNATGTIINDDAGPSVSIDNVSQAEGNSGSSNFAFTVSLSQASEQAVTVSYATSDGSAIAGSDYTATSGTVTFAPGVTSQTINVPVSGDTTKEASETFTVSLSSPVNATLGTATGTGTIVDDDNAPVLAIDNVSHAEGDTGSASFTFTVTLSQPSGETVTVNYATANGTAIAGDDYGATSGTLTFAPGVTSQTITVPVTGDAVSEPDETFSVTLSSSTNAPIGTTTGTGTIVNDDSAPSLAIADAAAMEGNSGTTNLIFTVTLSAPSEETITVQYMTTNGTAVAGTDYDTTSGTLTFAPNVTSQTVSVPIHGDVASEPDETFTVVLSAPTNAAIADSTATGTIESDDAPYVPAISIGDVSTAEGDFGATAVTFTVTLDAATTQPVSVDYHTTDIGAQQGSDYSPASGSLLFAPGTTSRTVTVNILGDEAVEPAETFALDLTNPVGATIADSRGIGTITNDDSTTPQPRITTSDASVTEGNEGLSDATISVMLSGSSDSIVTVDYTTADGTASVGSDYANSSGTIVFAPGTTTRTIHVPILGDRIDEENETLFVRLSRPAGARITDGEATVTIVDDDEAPAGATRSYIAIAGATAGVNGSFFRTILQLHNASDAPASGQVIFHPASAGPSPVVPYALAPHQTVEIEDAALSNGIGSADLVGVEGPAPLAVIRIVSTSDCGTVGMSSQSMDPSRDALTAPARGVLLVPSDLGNSRFNVGIRAIAADAALRLGLYDAAGNVKTQFDRTFAADALLHTSAADFFGMPVNANDSIRIEVRSGSVIAYGATTDNASQDPALQVAKPLP